MLELVITLFTINTRIVIKEMFLDIMIVFMMHKMGEVKQISIKNRTYYFYHDIISIKNVDARLSKVDKKSYKDIDIYNIGYITKKKIDECENIYSVNPLHLPIDHASGYVDEKDLNPLYLNIDHARGYIKKGINKYLVLDSTNKELLKKI